MHVSETHDVFIDHVRSFFVLFTACDKLLDKCFDQTNFWMDSLIRLYVPPIKIIAGHGRPIIARNNPINIDHRHDQKYHSLPQLLGLERTAHQILNEPLHHQAAIGFTRVYPSGDDDVFLTFVHWHGHFGIPIFELVH